MKKRKPRLAAQLLGDPPRSCSDQEWAPPCERSSPVADRRGGIARICVASIVVVAAVMVASTHAVVAWDKDGHQAVGMTASSALQSQTQTQVKRLLGGKDVGDVGSWAHRVAERYPESAELHFLFQRRNASCQSLEISEANCPQNRCLVRALQHFYLRLVGRPDEVPLKYPAELKLTDSDAVRFLVNLIGDLHQPCHLGFLEDDGGKHLLVSYVPPAGVTDEPAVPTTLFDYWDSALIQKVLHDRPSFWYGGWTHAQHMGTAQLLEIRTQWEKQDPDQRHKLFESWATESLSKVCASIYQNPRTSEFVTDGYRVSQTFEYLAFDLIRRQILTAGVRLALVLDSILKQERDVGRLRRGSAIVGVAVDDPINVGPLSSVRTEYFRSFGINFLIIVVVLSVIIYVKRYYSVALPVTPSPTPSPSHGRIDSGSHYGRPMVKQVGKRS